MDQAQVQRALRMSIAMSRAKIEVIKKSNYPIVDVYQAQMWKWEDRALHIISLDGGYVDIIPADEIVRIRIIPYDKTAIEPVIIEGVNDGTG
jgi:hypothetical protein